MKIMKKEVKGYHTKRSKVITYGVFMSSQQHRGGRFGSKVGQIGRKWDKSGTFSDQISVHLVHRIYIE